MPISNFYFLALVESNAEIEAVIWDMDGMLFDTERLSLIAWKAGAAAIGLEMSDTTFQSLIGMNSQAIQAKLRLELGEHADIAELKRVAGIEYDRLIANGPPVKLGAIECLRFLHENKVPQALATSSSYRYASRKLEHHNLIERFQAIVTGDQVEHGKPHPEPYLTAAQRLGVAPQGCLAFEDSVNGIKAAHDAGMRAILVPDICPHDEASLARVWRQFESLHEALGFLRQSFRAA